MHYRYRASRCGLVIAFAVVPVMAGPVTARAQSPAEFVPVSDAMLQDPAPANWLMWRRTLNSWGYSPLDEIDRQNVDQLRMVWSRALTPGSQQGTPLVYDGVMYMPNPGDVIQAINAVTGDLVWEYRRERPDDLEEHFLASLLDVNRNLAIHGNLIIDTSADDHVFALDATSGRLVWETQILDYTKNPAHQTSGPIIANGKIISGRGCMPRGGATPASSPPTMWRAARNCGAPVRFQPRASRGTRRGAAWRMRTGGMSAHGWCRATTRH